MSTSIDSLSKPAADAVRAAVKRKVSESAAAADQFFNKYTDQLTALAETMAGAFDRGHTLFTMGNGGSACDAEHVSVEFMHPIFEKRKALPCVSLNSHGALMSAVANDLDFSAVFSLQLNRLAAPGDMLLAVSTSGMSPNLVRALEEARKLNLVTIAFTGKDGGRLADIADWNFTVPSFSIHRIQETHVLLLHVLWDLIHIKLGEEDVI